MKEIDKKQAPEVSGGYFGPLETESPVPVGPMPTVPPLPTDRDGDLTTDKY
jgi:hypothetical protein